jgi:hypothetical protein
MWYGFQTTFNQVGKAPCTIEANQGYESLTCRASRVISNPLLQRTEFIQPVGFHFILLVNVSYSNFQLAAYFFNKTYFLNILFQQLCCELSFATHSLSLRVQCPVVFFKWLSYLNQLDHMLSKFTCPIFSKIKFKGKGYYIYKNYRNVVAPQFGYSHRIYIYSVQNALCFLTKTKILIFGWSCISLLKLGQKLLLTRPLNVFTGRGMRFVRQIVYRKTGKISSYR